MAAEVSNKNGRLDMRKMKGIDDQDRHVITKAYFSAPTGKRNAVAHAHGVSVSAIHAWRAKGYGMDHSDSPTNGGILESADDAILRVLLEALRRRIVTGRQVDGILELI